MKRTRKALLLILALTMSLMLFACGGKTCTSHVDANKDTKCDNCGIAVACTTCVDENKDAKCDVCGKDVACTTCVDENKDAKCDVCGKDVACSKCVDENADEKCDVCGKDVPLESLSEIVLIENGVPNFQFVLASGINVDVRKMVESTVIRGMERKSGIKLTSVTENNKDDVEMEFEVLVGDVTSRGAKYVYDRHELGKDGYMIKIVGTKILINAGSDEKLEEAVEEFAEDILDYENKKLDYAVMTAKNNIHKIQDNYKVTSLAIDGADMKGYTIAVDNSKSDYMAAAETLQDNIYDRTGYWFDIVALEDASAKSIVLKSIPKVYDENSFKVAVNGTQLLIECAFDNKLNDSVASFVLQKITLGKGDVNFTGTVLSQDISYVTYEDFGAVGDGETDDYQALYNAHVFANISGQTVKATPGKEYYLQNSRFNIDPSSNVKTVNPIPVMTNTIWEGASFIIDDSKINYFEDDDMATASIFNVVSGYERFNITDPEVLSGLGPIGYTYGTKKLDLGLGYPALLVVYNNNHKVYRRSGSTYINETKGTNQSGAAHELILIDAEGNIDPSTPFMFDYTELTNIYVMRADDTPITLKGGNFTTIACDEDALYTTAEGKEKKFGYYARGFNVSRSYTTLDGVKHFVTGEVTVQDHINGKEGAHYRGFLYGTDATDVKFLNCQVQGRRYYGVSGTYDLGGKLVNNFTFENCNQINFWVDADGNISDAENGELSMRWNDINGRKVRNCWGVGGTNYCKNMNYINSRLSRFDAHCGLYNGKVIGCEITFFAITGKGDFIIEDTTWYSAGEGATDNSLIYMRGDYGSTWEGSVTIKNVDAYVSSGAFYMFFHSYNNWDYGYKCYIPNIEIDNINLYNVKTKAAINEANISFFSGGKNNYMHLDTYPGAAEKVIIFTETTGSCIECVDNDRNAICDVCGAEGSYALTTDSTGTWRLDHPTDTYVKVPVAERVPDRNANPIGMPDYIKITNISKDYIFSFVRSEDPNFYFANTKFYYGTGENDYYKGTNHDSDKHIVFQ